MRKPLAELVDEIAPKSRSVTTLFEGTPQWKALRPLLEGDIPPNKMVHTFMTPAEFEKFQISNPRTITRFLSGYVRKHFPEKHLKVGLRNRDGGVIEFYVKRRPRP